MPIDAANPVPTSYPRLAGADQIPDHVPPELIRTTGLTFGPNFLAAPHKFMAEMHNDLPPIFFDISPFSNQWCLTKHSDAFFMLRNPEVFSNEGATPFPRDPNDYFYFIPIEIDPPEHNKYRAILAPVFSPAGVSKLEQKIRDLSNSLIDEFIDTKQCEFTTDFGRPLPVSVFLDIMGLPQEKRDTFVKWAVDLLHSNDREIMGRTMHSITQYLKEAIEDKRQNPDDAVISRIVHAEIDGRPMSGPEIFGFVCFLFIAGLDTVFATLNNMWLWLAQNPDRCREMMNDPENIDNQVEELLRCFSVTFSGRMVAKDFEMRGVQFKKGDRVTAILPACNFDPDIFPNPTEIDFSRPRKPILAFGQGVHSCMGAHLARLEIKIAIQEWLKRIPEFELAENAEIIYKPGGVVGPEYVPLVWS